MKFLRQVFLAIPLAIAYPLSASSNEGKITVASDSGEKLLVTPVESCFVKSTGTYFSVRGEWDFSGRLAQLLCKGRKTDLLSIRNGDKKPRAEYLLARGHELVRSADGFDFYDHYPAGKKSGRVISYVGFDGRRVYVIDHPDFPYNYTVFRQLDDHFEVTYGIHNLTPSPSDLKKYDEKIMAYVHSITRKE